MVTDPAAYHATAEALLDAHTLVLNRHWVAVGVTRVRRAIGLVYVDSARVISPDTYVSHDFDSWTELSEEAPDHECVHGVTVSFRVPEIILLTQYAGMPRAGVAFSRRNLLIRDHFTCQYCGNNLDSQSLTIDHLVPRSRGGTSTWLNCVLSCVRCNSRKGSRTPEEAGMQLLSKPSRPVWTPSFGIPRSHRRPSWRKFLKDSHWETDEYWDVELEP